MRELTDLEFELVSSGEKIKFGEKLTGKVVKKEQFGSFIFEFDDVLSPTNVVDYMHKGVIKKDKELIKEMVDIIREQYHEHCHHHHHHNDCHDDCHCCHKHVDIYHPNDKYPLRVWDPFLMLHDILNPFEHHHHHHHMEPFEHIHFPHPHHHHEAKPHFANDDRYFGCKKEDEWEHHHHIQPYYELNKHWPCDKLPFSSIFNGFKDFLSGLGIENTGRKWMKANLNNPTFNAFLVKFLSEIFDGKYEHPIRDFDVSNISKIYSFTIPENGKVEFNTLTNKSDIQAIVDGGFAFRTSDDMVEAYKQANAIKSYVNGGENKTRKGHH